MSSFKGTLAYWKQFLYDVLAMVKQLGIPIYFLTFPCADLIWGDVPYIFNKLNNLGLSDGELRNLSYQVCNLLNNNPVLVARSFSIKLKYFSKKLYLMVHWEKQNAMLYVLNFVKRVAHMSIHLYGFSMQQIFKMKLPTLSLLRKQ